MVEETAIAGQHPRPPAPRVESRPRVQSATVVDLGGKRFWLMGGDVDPSISISVSNLLGDASELTADRVDLFDDHILLNCDHLRPGLYIVSFRKQNGSNVPGLLRHFEGLLRLYGSTATVFGPGFGAPGFLRSLDGFERLCPSTFTDFFFWAMDFLHVCSE